MLREDVFDVVSNSENHSLISVLCKVTIIMLKVNLYSLSSVIICFGYADFAFKKLYL